MTQLQLLQKIWLSLRKEGIAETINIIRKNVLLNYWKYENKKFDRKYGVDTGGQIQSDALKTDSPNKKVGVRYEPTTLRTFRSIMKNFEFDLGKFTFIDFGSGKGRALILASSYGFRKIIGIEYARDLHDIALKNLATFVDKTQKCSDIECIHLDATEYPIPPVPTIFYFYQPFAGDVMNQVLANIGASLQLAPRKIVLVFLHPHPSLIRQQNLFFLTELKSKPLPIDLAWRHTRELALYTNDESLP